MSIENKKILIVDDDHFLIDMYSLKFKNRGAIIEAASSSKEALDKLENDLNPDIIILDIIMPGMDGIALLKEITERDLVKDAVVIMLTNQSLQEDIEKAKKFKVDGYIVKATRIPSEVVNEVEQMYINRKKI